MVELHQMTIFMSSSKLRKDPLDSISIKTYKILYDLSFYYKKTNRSHVAVCLFSNRSQKTSKCGKNINNTLGYHLVHHFLFLPHFDITCDLLLNRCTAIWNLFFNFIVTAYVACVIYQQYVAKEEACP